MGETTHQESGRERDFVASHGRHNLHGSIRKMHKTTPIIVKRGRPVIENDLSLAETL